MVSVVIPAFNEEKTIGKVIRAVKEHPSVHEVIVVNDSSNDNTCREAENAGAKVITLRNNLGKAGAMNEGVREARSEIVLFLDADRTGYDHKKISKIIDPVSNQTYEMFVGVADREIFHLNLMSHFFPIIGGERAVTKKLWTIVPPKFKKNFMIETALNFYAKKTLRGMGHVLIEGIDHMVKEEKYGYLRGFKRRIVMTFEVLYISFRLYIVENVLILLRELKDSDSREIETSLVKTKHK